MCRKENMTYLIIFAAMCECRLLNKFSSSLLHMNAGLYIGKFAALWRDEPVMHMDHIASSLLEFATP